MVGPQTIRNGVVAIDPHTTRSGVAWDHSLGGTNDDMSRFGVMPSCGGVRRSTKKTERMHFLQLINVLAWCAGRTVHCLPMNIDGIARLL
jgi:hypothetical protein